MTTARDTRKAPPQDAAQLLRLRRAELDGLFARSEAGPVPDGEYRGALILPLDAVPLRGLAASAGRLAWRGKVFDAGARRVINRVLPFGVRAVTADVRRGPSRLDGRECIVLDYSRTSLIARGVCDELRLLRPGLYLGQAYWHGLRVAAVNLLARRLMCSRTWQSARASSTFSSTWILIIAGLERERDSGEEARP